MLTILIIFVCLKNCHLIFSTEYKTKIKHFSFVYIISINNKGSIRTFNFLFNFRKTQYANSEVEFSTFFKIFNFRKHDPKLF